MSKKFFVPFTQTESHDQLKSIVGRLRVLRFFRCRVVEEVKNKREEVKIEMLEQEIRSGLPPYGSSHKTQMPSLSTHRYPVQRLLLRAAGLPQLVACAGN